MQKKYKKDTTHRPGKKAQKTLTIGQRIARIFYSIRLNKKVNTRNETYSAASSRRTAEEARQQGILAIDIHNNN